AFVSHPTALAEDVVEMAGKVDELKTRLLMNTAIAVRDADDAETMVGVMQVGAVAYRISGAAADIARTVLLGLVPDPRVLEALAKTKEGLVRTRILPNSVLAGKPLGKLKLETNIGVNVIVVRRGKELLTNPGPEVSLAEGDVLIARGSDVGVSELDKLAKGELKAIPRPKLGEKEGA
ncbi:MAG: TrkA C-terminal domain-containing protein, partial [Thermoproteota archaeon]